MCLSIPAEVLTIQNNMAVVKIGGMKTMACLDLIVGICEGDYVLVHTGFVIQKITPQEAEETIQLIRDIDNFNPAP